MGPNQPLWFLFLWLEKRNLKLLLIVLALFLRNRIAEFLRMLKHPRIVRSVDLGKRKQQILERTDCVESVRHYNWSFFNKCSRF